MEKNTVIRHFATIGIGTFMVVVINAITVPMITRLVDPFDYGMQSLFTTYGTLAASFLYLGMDQSFIRFFYDSDRIEDRNKLLYQCLKPTIILSMILMLVFIFLKISGRIDDAYDLSFIVCVCIYSFIIVIDRFASLILRLDYKTKQYSAISVISKSAYVVVALYLVLSYEENHAQMLIASTLISAGISMILNILSQKHYWLMKRSERTVHVVSTFQLVKYGLPFIVSAGVGSIFNVIDKLSIERFGTYSDVGVYSSALSLVGIFSIIQMTFCTLWMPMAIEHYEKEPDDRRFYIKGHNMITVTVFFAGFSLILIKDLFVLLLGEKYRESAYLVPFLVFHPIMWTVSETTVCGLYFKKRSTLQIIPPFVACLVNVIGNTVLIRLIGYKGVAISTGLSYIVFFIMRTVLGLYFYPVKYDLKAYAIMTWMLIAFAFYNTFVPFNEITVIMYVVSVLLLVSLYKTTVLEILSYVKNISAQKGV